MASDAVDPVLTARGTETDPARREAFSDPLADAGREADPASAGTENAADVCAGCGGAYRFDTVVPNVVWNSVIRAAGMPEYLCTTCIVRAFAKAGVSFTAELWGEEFNGLPVAVHFNSRSARFAQLLSNENTTLRHGLSEAERACKTLRERTDQHAQEIASLRKQLNEMTDFNRRAHRALNAAGVPTSIDMPPSTEPMYLWRRVDWLAARLASREAEITALRAALMTYGQHKSDCELRDPLEEGNYRFFVNGPTGQRDAVCTCGFDLLLQKRDGA